MSDLILSLPHYHIHIAIYVVQIINTILCRVSFTGFAFYIAVRYSFDKHLHVKSCLNAHNHNSCIRLSQTGCIVRKMALFIISQDRQTQVQVPMATTIIIDPAKCSTASACNNPSDNITETRYLGTVRLLQTKTKQSPIC